MITLTRKGDWVWTSPNGVPHYVLATGTCITCGRLHTDNKEG